VLLKPHHVHAEPRGVNRILPGAFGLFNLGFEWLSSSYGKMVQTESLNIGYEQTGPDSGEPILLLHGWPYDPRSFDDVRGPLADAGYRVIVPYLRCFGPTVYRSPGIFRSGQQSALGKDIIDLMDVLRIEKATLIGYDWGGRGACVAAALWPDRVKALMSMHGYTILDVAKDSKRPGDIKSIHQQWYRWYMNTPLGATELEENRDDFTHECWVSWSPTWRFSEAEFAATAKSFHNPDWVATTLNCYRSWYGNAPGDPALQKYEGQLAKLPKISVPTIVLQGDSDPLYPLSATDGQEGFYTSGGGAEGAGNGGPVS
jgi:pimeloyl-ACP methyl ester carboxylesterase